jgi:hypothetical protein
LQYPMFCGVVIISGTPPAGVDPSRKSPGVYFANTRIFHLPRGCHKLYYRWKIQRKWF